MTRETLDRQLLIVDMEELIDDLAAFWDEEEPMCQHFPLSPDALIANSSPLHGEDEKDVRTRVHAIYRRLHGIPEPNQD